jgi:plastocyanin
MRALVHTKSILRSLALATLMCAGCSGPVAGVDAGRDAAASDGGRDGSSLDAPAIDAHVTPTPDAGVDAAIEDDAGSDAASPEDGGTDAAAPVDAGTADAGTADAGTDAATPVDAGTDAAAPMINGCTRATATEITDGRDATVTFGGAVGSAYAPRCIAVSLGANVTFDGFFPGHPLEGGTVVGTVLMPAASGPFIPATSSGTTRTFTMSSAGTFPYYCQFHGPSGMSGVVYVE